MGLNMTPTTPRAALKQYFLQLTRAGATERRARALAAAKARQWSLDPDMVNDVVDELSY